MLSRFRNETALGEYDLLLSAYRCAKGLGSEPEVGYQALLEALRSGLRVILVTREKDATSLKKMHDWGDQLEIIGYELSAFVVRLKGLGLLPRWVYYICWQVSLGRSLRDARIKVRAAHHVTFASDWMPIGILQLRDVPFLCGPIGGSTSLKVRHARHLGLRTATSLWLRAILTHAPRKMLIRKMAASRRATLLVQNRDTAHCFDTIESTICENTSAGWISETIALNLADFDSFAGPTSHDISIAFVGRLIPWKGSLFLLDVLRQWAKEDPTIMISLDVYGDGRLRGVAARRRIPNNLTVNLHGHRPRDQVLEALSRRPIVALPSVREGSPTIVTECVALGCPVVTLDVAGCGHLARKYGIPSVKVGAEVKRDFAEALRAAHTDPHLFVGSASPSEEQNPNFTWRKWYSTL